LITLIDRKITVASPVICASLDKSFTTFKRCKIENNIEIQDLIFPADRCRTFFEF